MKQYTASYLTLFLKKENVGNELMRLGAALAVIKYNDGYQGIKEVLRLLE